MKVNYEMVDLGLPSGLKWAKCNLGAEKETDYGLYFQWGDTVGYEGDEAEAHSSSSTVPYYDKLSNTYTKYNPSFDKKVTLDKYDDAVSKIMGLSYRMPTKEDFEELLANTNSEWINNYKNSGKNGRLFISKINGKTLFFPATGYYGTCHFYFEGTFGYVWSSSLNTSNTNNSLYFSFHNNICHANFFSRYVSRSLRGVSRISQ